MIIPTPFDMSQSSFPTSSCAALADIGTTSAAHAREAIKTEDIVFPSFGMVDVCWPSRSKGHLPAPTLPSRAAIEITSMSENIEVGPNENGPHSGHSWSESA
jgi:hypothetical protein